MLVSLCQAGSPPGIILRDSTPSGLPFTEYTGGTEPGFTCILPLNAQTMLQEVLIILMLQVGQPRLRQVKLLTHSPGCGASRGTDSDRSSGLKWAGCSYHLVPAAYTATGTKAVSSFKDRKSHATCGGQPPQKPPPGMALCLHDWRRKKDHSAWGRSTFPIRPWVGAVLEPLVGVQLAQESWEAPRGRAKSVLLCEQPLSWGGTR